MTSSPSAGDGSVNPWVPVALGCYLLAAAAVALWLLVDVWSRNFVAYRWLLGTEGLTRGQVDVVTPLSYCVVGGVLGAVILSFQGLHEYAAVRGTFRASYSGSYLVGPWVAAIIALAAYALVRGGLLIFGGQSAPGAPGASNYAYLALGILTGYAWNKVLRKLGDVANQLFASSEPTAAQRDRPPEAPPAGPGV